MDNMDANEIFESKVVCIVSPGDKFNENIIKIVKVIKNKRVCYVTLNKGADALLEYFKKNKIKSENFFFIDCVSKTITSPKSKSNCVFVSSPNALTELSLAITKCIDSDFSVILIDSLSTFMIYHKAETMNHFFHNLSNKIRTKEGENLILILSNKDKNSEVFKKIELLVDKVVEMK